MKLTLNDVSQQTSWELLQRFSSINFDSIRSAINGGLSFSDNFAAQIVGVTFTAANTQVTVSHSLNRVPSGYIPVSLSAALIVYNGATAFSSSALYLKSSAVGNAQVLVFLGGDEMSGILDFFAPSSGDVSGAGMGGVSPELLQNVQSMQDQAKAYNQNLPYYLQDYSNLMGEQAANDKYNQTRQIRSNASNRGLLYSGLREGAESQNNANIASSLAQRRANLNQQGMQSGFQATQQGAMAGLDVGNLQTAINKQKYDAIQKAKEMDPGLVGGFLKGFGL